ncbi:BppU family phage baseplate upper protein [Peribacillus simplex]|uniref:BppU N-terminal domain-containing protein n=1 Tax=Peribacillus simplex TaxID=1478 RepID=A0A9W4KWR6_9BACI|nr:BppU family phage baseplate upper protein [Peribacillus simplex]CAH0185704.1 hypothetical protein SRABI133_01538 [Peribacillus simplex]
MIKNFDISIDTTKGIRNQAISVNTNDLQTLQFSFTITQSGVPVNLTGATVRLAVKKPDKKTVFQDCIITDAVNGKCEIVLDTQAYIVPGLHPVELMIYYAADKVSVTGRFSYTANKGILDDGSVVSTNEFQAINQALTDVENIVVDLRDNGTGIDVQARTDLQTVTTQLADTGKVMQDKLTKINPLRAPFNVIGNANYFNNTDKKWYTNSSLETAANDDTQGIKAFFEYIKANAPYDLIVFPSKKYLITSPIVIPQECRNIDFNFSNFQYLGAANTFCLSGGAITGTTPAEGFSGGYTHANWRNLYIWVDPSGSKTANGIDITRLRNSTFTNITVDGANIGIKMNETWTSSLEKIKVYRCNIGISTGRSANGTNISKGDIEGCGIGLQIGNPGAIGDTWGTNGLVVDSATLFQNCDTAIELHFIKMTSVVNSYFEGNNRVLDIPVMGVNDTINNFTFENNLIDTAPNKECFLRLRDNNRRISMNIRNNSFTGVKPLNTLFHRDSGVLGTIGKMDITGDIFHGLSFGDIFPLTWKMGSVKTDIPYTPTIDTTKWDIYQTVQIECLGNNKFELTGAIKRKSGATGVSLITGLPYYFTSESLKFNYLVPQTIDGAGGNKKTARVEVHNLQKVDIYTDDTTDLNPINLSGIRWSARN